MSATIGDGISTLAIAGGIVGYLYFKHQSKRQRIEVIHQERMAAMEKGISLPEFPLEQTHEPRPGDRDVIKILGIVLFTLSIGAMIALYWNRSAAPTAGFWVFPLPFAFLGVGLVAFELLNGEPRR